MKTIAILAGNYQQFQEHKNIFCEPVSEKMIYVNRLESLIGMRFDEHRIVGTFWDRRDAWNLHREVLGRLTDI